MRHKIISSLILRRRCWTISFWSTCRATRAHSRCFLNSSRRPRIPSARSSCSSGSRRHRPGDACSTKIQSSSITGRTLSRQCRTNCTTSSHRSSTGTSNLNNHSNLKTLFTPSTLLPLSTRLQPHPNTHPSRPRTPLLLKCILVMNLIRYQLVTPIKVCAEFKINTAPCYGKPALVCAEWGSPLECGALTRTRNNFLPSGTVLSRFARTPGRCAPFFHSRSNSPACTLTPCTLCASARSTRT